MSLVHLHLFLNHVPAMATIFAIVMLVAALLLKNSTLRQTSLVLFVLAALAAIPVYLTGEPAEKSVEGLAGVSHAVIEQHEDAAKVALIALLAMGGLSLVGLAVSRRGRPMPQAMAMATVVASLVVGGLILRTANLGGQVRHSEIRAPGSAVSASAGETGTSAEARGEESRHDED